MISFNFNETGRFFTCAFNYQSLWLLAAIAIPFPWYGVHRDIRTLAEPTTGFYIRYKHLVLVIRKSGDKESS